MTLLTPTEAEIREIAPVLYAEQGELFIHEEAAKRWHHDQDVDIVSFEGRTDNNWLIFRYVEGPGLKIMNGGIRDSLGAWPIADYTVVGKEDDPDVLRLPLSMCYGFREFCGSIYDQPDEDDEDDGSTYLCEECDCLHRFSDIEEDDEEEWTCDECTIQRQLNDVNMNDEEDPSLG
jgi:hypothetical protein